jgi:hypothetical protein
MPWQRYAAEVVREQLPSGAFAAPIAVVSVPRQSGKTTWLRSVGVAECLSGFGRQVFYTAQTGKDGRARWVDMLAALHDSPLNSQMTVRRSQGSERFEFRNGSFFQVFAPVMDALHGYVPHLVMLDEIMAHSEELGDALLAAILPAQVTLMRKQLILVSTAGNAASGFMRKILALARSGAEGVCLVEYAVPDGEDVYDMDVMRRYNPSFDENGETYLRPDGTPQITVRELERQAEILPRAEYERAYGNRWTVTFDSLIGVVEWGRLRVDGGISDPGARNVVLALDVAHDGSAATVLAAWRQGDRMVGRVVARDVGYGWCASYVDNLVAEARPIAVAARDDGLAREVVDRLTCPPDLVVALSPRDWSMASGAMLRMFREGEIGHDGDDEIATAAYGTVGRPSSDGLSFSARHSVGDVSAFFALTAGAWVYDHRPATGKPVIKIAS